MVSIRAQISRAASGCSAPCDARATASHSRAAARIRPSAFIGPSRPVGTRRMRPIAAALLAACATALESAELIEWDTRRYHRRTSPRANYTFDVSASTPYVVCALGDRAALGAVLRLFDEVRLTVWHEEAVEVRVVSDDSSFADLVSPFAAVDRARAIAISGAVVGDRGDAEGGVVVGWLVHALTGSLSEIRDTASNLLHGRRARRRAYRFSPFLSSCVALSRRAASHATVRVEMRVRRFGALHSGRSVAGGADADADADGRAGARAWAGGALLVVGALLLLNARKLSESLAFHYAGGAAPAPHPTPPHRMLSTEGGHPRRPRTPAAGISISVALGVSLLLLFTWRRVARGPRRHLLSIATLLGYLGAIASALKHSLLALIRAYWPYALAYAGAFGALGYFATFYRLKGGRPEVWESQLLAQARHPRPRGASARARMPHSSPAGVAPRSSSASSPPSCCYNARSPRAPHSLRL